MFTAIATTTLSDNDHVMNTDATAEYRMEYYPDTCELHLQFCVRNDSGISTLCAGPSFFHCSGYAHDLIENAFSRIPTTGTQESVYSTWLSIRRIASVYNAQWNR